MSIYGRTLNQAPTSVTSTPRVLTPSTNPIQSTTENATPRSSKLFCSDKVFTAIEKTALFAGCALFIASAIEELSGPTNTAEKENNILIIAGSTCYALAVAFSMKLRENPELALKATTLPLAATLGSFLTFGIKQYTEGGSVEVFVATIIFTAAIIARVMHHKLQTLPDITPNIKDTVLIFHYLAAIMGSVIFGYVNAMAFRENPKSENPGLTGALGAASLAASKLTGLSLTIKDVFSRASTQSTEGLHLLSGSMSPRHNTEV